MACGLAFDKLQDYKRRSLLQKYVNACYDIFRCPVRRRPL